VPPSEVAYVLGRAGVQLSPDVPEVTYAMSCWFRGWHVPHLVVRTANGPMAVMLLRHERVAARQVFDEGFRFDTSGLLGRRFAEIDHRKHRGRLAQRVLSHLDAYRNVNVVRREHALEMVDARLLPLDQCEQFVDIRHRGES